MYLDNCCFNRPYDEQSMLRVKLETQAKLSIQKMILEHRIELAWSFILEYENDCNPSAEKRKQIALWQNIAVVDCNMSDFISVKSEELVRLGLRTKDALHVSCAINTHSGYFITVDKGILNKGVCEIKVLNPVDFIFMVEGEI